MGEFNNLERKEIHQEGIADIAMSPEVESIFNSLFDDNIEAGVKDISRVINESSKMPNENGESNLEESENHHNGKEDFSMSPEVKDIFNSLFDDNTDADIKELDVDGVLEELDKISNEIDDLNDAVDSFEKALNAAEALLMVDGIAAVVATGGAAAPVVGAAEVAGVAVTEVAGTVATEAVEVAATEAVEVAATEAVEVVATEAVEAVATEAVETVATEAVENVATEAIENVAAESVESLAPETIEHISSNGGEIVNSNNVGDIFRGMNDGISENGLLDDSFSGSLDHSRSIDGSFDSPIEKEEYNTRDLLKDKLDDVSESQDNKENSLDKDFEDEMKKVKELINNEGEDTKDEDNKNSDINESETTDNKQENNVESKEVKTKTPESNGQWEGERGNSKWIPDKDYIPPEKSRNPEEKPYSNPDNLTWGEIMEKYGIDGITFKDGFPDFSEVSKGNVEIEGFETGGNLAKTRNLKKADIALAEQKGCSPAEVTKWREENNYTWHECEDKKTLQKVPNEVHANIQHDGGRSQKD